MGIYVTFSISLLYGANRSAEKQEQRLKFYKIITIATLFYGSYDVGLLIEQDSHTHAVLLRVVGYCRRIDHVGNQSEKYYVCMTSK
jgi:hypothetical protein